MTSRFIQLFDDIFMNNPWIVFISLIIGILGTFFSAYSLKGMQRKRIEVRSNSYNIINNSVSRFTKLKILYDEKTVDSLTITKITFWSNSFATIRGDDLIVKEPFTISFSDASILDVSILKESSPSNFIEVTCIDKSTIKITFDYLDKNEGCIIQVIHTGEKIPVNVSKKIKGGSIETKKSIIRRLGLLLTEEIPIYESDEFKS